MQYWFENDLKSRKKKCSRNPEEWHMLPNGSEKLLTFNFSCSTYILSELISVPKGCTK